MKKSPAHVNFRCAATLAAFLPAVLQADPIGLTLTLQYATVQDNPIFNGYTLFPGLNTSTARLTETRAESFADPDPRFGTILPPGETNSGGGSVVFDNFSNYKSAINATPWTLTLDAGTATPTIYEFVVDASALTDWVTTPVLIGAGQQGTSYASGSSPTFTWTSLNGYDSGYAQIYDSTFAFNESAGIGPGDSSYTTPSNLAPGTYTFLVNYSTDRLLTAPLTVSIPSNAGGAYGEWAGLNGLSVNVSDSISFTVVPEPGSAILLLGAVAGISLTRRRRA